MPIREQKNEELTTAAQAASDSRTRQALLYLVFAPASPELSL